MILSDVRNYLIDQRRVALIDLANHFGVDADALRGMLDKWIRKGSLRKLPSGTACGTNCCKCDPASIEIYEWIDQTRN
ncbi:MAG: FeoC-like transcriptional regulator [Gammaproteobacteria bacterium]